jgi:hypothetical protein
MKYSSTALGSAKPALIDDAAFDDGEHRIYRHAPCSSTTPANYRKRHCAGYEVRDTFCAVSTHPSAPEVNSPHEGCR